MNILILNGSPKGDYSITLQTVLYLKKLHPEHQFEILHVGQRIRSLEKDFSPACAALTRADILLFSYPVYTFMAPSQLHRFMELLKESGISLAGVYATQLTTSKHFYDVTAHRYIQDNCQDLGMKYIRGLSADMEDLTTEKGQKEARAFFDYVCWSMEQDSYEPIPNLLPAAAPVPVTVPIKETDPSNPASAAGANAPGSVPAAENASKPVIIVTDCKPQNKQLQAMIDRFQAVFPYPARIVNIQDYPFKGGCIGCFQCAASGICIYKDGFDTFLREQIQTAPGIVYAFSIQDHSMGSRFKLYDDRQFCNGHRTVTMGTPVAYLISGSYSKEYNLQMIVEARASVGGNFLAGVATDEADPDTEIDRLAAALAYGLEHRYLPPQNFFGVGGMKIFRDLIWQMQGLMRADHKFFKAHGQYDFPQKQRGKILVMYLVGSMMASPKLRSKIGSKMNEGMIAPYKKVLENLEEKSGR